jgi:uncharacterized membrane protein
VHIDWRAAAFEHLHNKIVHFPIALGLAAAIILIVTPRWPQYDAAGQALLAAAALFAIAAYFTGRLQAEPFEGTSMWDIVGLHATLGTLTALLLIAGVVLTRVRAAKRWLWVYGVALFLIISATGFVGGVLAHGQM